MSKSQINIREPERVLLTETLPYELPLFFNNAGLAALAVRVRTGKDHNLHFHRHLLLSRKHGPGATKPLSFNIRKNAIDSRRISLPHPRAQHAFVEFYQAYDQFIVHSCSISDFSLRHPTRVGSFFYDKRYTDESLHMDPSEPDVDPVGFHDQRKWASSYFSYRINQSYKFFESDDFLSLEQRFNYLRKLDVARCFDSIYTHSIVWAGRGKDFAKRHKGPKIKFFEAHFDTLLQNANWGETHGIIVGPEFSRVFAEVILQRVDARARHLLQRDDKQREVVVRRYVDDFYIFANDEAALDAAECHISNSLREFNLFLNSHKRESLVRPFLSAISASRSRVSMTIENLFDRAQEVLQRATPQARPAQLDKLCVNAINEVRMIARELNVSYAQISSFGLGVLSRQINRSRLMRAPGPNEQPLPAPLLLAFLIGVLRLAQFFYNTDRRVNTSIKLARVFQHISAMAEARGCALGPLKGQMLDLVRASAPTTADLEVEVIARINLMIATDLSIRSAPQLTPDDLAAVIGKGDPASMSYFELIGALFICRRRSKFDSFRQRITAEIQERLVSAHPRSVDSTEWVLLLTDFLSCPYIDASKKHEVIIATHESVCGTTCSTATAQAIAAAAKDVSFVDWSGSYNLSRLLARKELTAAYD